MRLYIIKHKTIDTPKMVNIFFLYVSTLSHLQKKMKMENIMIRCFF